MCGARFQGGLLCHAYEMLRSFLVALDRSVHGEQEQATQVSDEEWEAIRPSKEERMATLLAHIKVDEQKQSKSSAKTAKATYFQLQAASN